MIRYVNDCGGKYTIGIRNDADEVVGYALWGDQVRIEGPATSGWTPIKTGRIRTTDERAWIPSDCLTNTGLLELYVIDVGQGDGVLMRTPDDKWHVVDAGIANRSQMTKKGAANFIRWKFIEDLGKASVELESITITHPDYDHYGGVIDILSGKLHDGRTFPISARNFWHSGMGRFETQPKLGKAKSGTVSSIPHPHYGVNEAGTFIVELLDSKSSFVSPSRAFDPSFEELARLVGTVPQTVGRLDSSMKFVPGYGVGNPSGVVMNLLGPVCEAFGSQVGLREFSGEGTTRNGHSIVIRLDYGQCKILLTGDLNTESQRLLLSYHPSTEYAADVVKGCHHGSDDIDLRFVRAMAGRATIISSGDNEDYAHPRPRVMGASARYGRDSKSAKKDEQLPPLIYSTELARSVKLEYAEAIRESGTTQRLLDADNADVKPVGEKYRKLSTTPISTDLIYGLVNVRTDGNRVLCATMKERGNAFDIQVFRAGVEP